MGGLDRMFDLAGAQIDCHIHLRAFFFGYGEASGIAVSRPKEDAKRGDKGVQILELRTEMAWAPDDFPGVHDAPRSESRVNAVPHHNVAAACTYDLAVAFYIGNI